MTFFIRRVFNYDLFELSDEILIQITARKKLLLNVDKRFFLVMRGLGNQHNLIQLWFEHQQVNSHHNSQVWTKQSLDQCPPRILQYY